MEEKPTKYILKRISFKDLQDKCQNAQNAGSYTITLYDCKIDRSDLSEEQKQIQNDYAWRQTYSGQLYISQDDIQKEISKKAYQLIGNIGTNKVYDKMVEEMANTQVIICASITKENNGSYRAETYTELAEDEGCTYSNDLDEFKTKLKDVKYSDYHNNDVYLEELEFTVYTYRYNSICDKASKMVKRFIKENLAYCTKNGVLIVPEEYTQRGKDGIDEWVKLKRASNKNNSIEKKILRQTVADKKKFIQDTLDSIIFKIITSGANDWSLPKLEVDGRFNKQKISKLANKIFKDASKQQMIEMSKEEIVDKIKEYWKGELMKAHNAVDKAIINMGE